MQFEATLDRKAIAEAGRMLRRWYYWPLFLLKNIYGILLLGVLIYAGILLNLFGPDPHPRKAGYSAIAVVAILAVGWWFVRRDLRKEKAGLDKINPIRFIMQPDGINVIFRDGNAAFTPWRQFASFREGNGIFLIYGTAPKSYQIVPKNGLSAHDADRLRSQFIAQIPAAIR